MLCSGEQTTIHSRRRQFCSEKQEKPRRYFYFSHSPETHTGWFTLAEPTVPLPSVQNFEQQAAHSFFYSAAQGQKDTDNSSVCFGSPTVLLTSLPVHAPWLEHQHTGETHLSQLARAKPLLGKRNQHRINATALKAYGPAVFKPGQLSALLEEFKLLAEKSDC